VKKYFETNDIAAITTRLVDGVTTPMLLKLVLSGKLDAEKLITHSKMNLYLFLHLSPFSLPPKFSSSPFPFLILSPHTTLNWQNPNYKLTNMQNSHSKIWKKHTKLSAQQPNTKHSKSSLKCKKNPPI